MARRIVAVAARPKLSCPFVHQKGKETPACQTCHRAFTQAELRESREACNGDERCAEGKHIPRICERCAHLEEHDERQA